MIESILIAGGGSAGWITANVLHAVLNNGDQPNISITLVESPNIPIIGVGEATVPSIRRTLQTIGISETEFMRATDATFKSMIRFVGWNEGQFYDHPFDRRSRPDTDGSVQTWLQADHQKNGFARTFSLLSTLAENGYAPKALGWPDYGSTFPYAYHLDAAKLAAVLTRFGTARGIKQALANIEEVKVGSGGEIEAIKTDTGQTLSADLYIDCTGFASVLIGKLSEEVHDYSEHLLCDSAVTFQVPFELHQPEKVLPYTEATARSAGWNWDINLQGRRGLGYVYSSAHKSPDQAERELRQAEGDHCRELEARHIRFRSSKRKSSWISNCVAVGLSDGFLEPLESSGLYTIEFAAQALAELIPHMSSKSRAVSSIFNTQMMMLYEEVLDFLCLHYATSTRRDSPFWVDATDPERVPDQLKFKLELWRTKPPTELDFFMANRLFSIESYEYVLFGMRYARPRSATSSSPIPNLGEMLEKCYRKFPSHDQWLASL